METQGAIKGKSFYSVSALIALCFFWGGSGFLVWSSQLGQFFDSDAVLLISECIGYLIQFTGVVLCGLAVKYIPKIAFSRHILPMVGIVFLLSIIASVALNTIAFIIVGGVIANLTCGYAQGHYLTYLTCLVPQQQRGRSFAFSYALGAIGTYIASALCGGLYSYGTIVAVGAAIGLTILLSYRSFPDLHSVIASQPTSTMTDMKYFRKLFLQMCALVFLFNIVY